MLLIRSVKNATSNISFSAMSWSVVTPWAVRVFGRGEFGRAPWASFSIVNSELGLGLGKPFGRGNLNGDAATLTTAADRVRSEVKCMVEAISVQGQGRKRLEQLR